MQDNSSAEAIPTGYFACCWQDLRRYCEEGAHDSEHPLIIIGKLPGRWHHTEQTTMQCWLVHSGLNSGTLNTAKTQYVLVKDYCLKECFIISSKLNNIVNTRTRICKMCMGNQRNLTAAGRVMYLGDLMQVVFVTSYLTFLAAGGNKDGKYAGQMGFQSSGAGCVVLRALRGDSANFGIIH